MRLDGVRALSRPRHDELLYSAMARVSTYLGSPPASRLHGALFDEEVPVVDSDLPVGLDAVVRSGVFGVADLRGAADEWTLLRYHAHYVAPARADAVVLAMSGRGRWPFEPLGGPSSTLPPVDRLRFCLECREDMLERHPDLWWRRTHQLPSTMVCPEHGLPLRVSSVTRERRRAGYVPAALDVCRSDESALVVSQEPRVMGDLLAIARAGDALLDVDGGEHPDDRRMRYLGALDRLRLLNRGGKADLHGLARAMDGYWGTTLDVWPGLREGGRCGQRWLGRLLLSGRDSPPLHHLLLEAMLSARLGRST